MAGLLNFSGLSAAPEQDQPLLEIGVAKVDITPEYPVRLSGYGMRTTELEGVAQRIWAKALAIGTDESGPAVLLTVDNTGVPGHVTEEIFQRVAKAAPAVRRENFALASSHTHCAPMLSGSLPFLFSADIVREEQERIDQYTEELIDKLRDVVIRALESREPAALAWGEGRVGFARNRREAGGPVDHSLPILAVRSPEGTLRAVLANYACHCTTLSFNQVHGDWAGSAQEFIEQDFPGAIALISIGAGADANPSPRGEVAHAEDHGRELANEVGRLLSSRLTPLTQGPAGRLHPTELSFDTLPSREEFARLSEQPGIVGYHAKTYLGRINAGDSIPETLPYTVQAWHFGEELAMVFLPGEVVSDYALRLKNEFERVWVTSYANDVPCYIPSERVLNRANAEYRYEAATSILYYGQPTRFAHGIEQRIIDAVHAVVPEPFLAVEPWEREEPLSPEASMKRIDLSPEYVIDLVASEPEVVDPVAIDFGPDGRLWVAEMRDYPSGMHNNWEPGGRIKVLEDRDGDGRFETATVFADDLPFPTGLLAWRGGVLICAAPDILFAEDTDGDGRADRIEKLFTGFATENYQARVNGLSYGLDNWIYGANGLLSGTITRVSDGEVFDIRGRDFRMNPDTGEFEAVAGLTQQGRVRDDFGNWFGSDNSNVGWHFPLPERYLRRNPHVTPPAQRVFIGTGENPHRIYPTSRTAERFNRPEHANRVTAACGETIYRDTLFGEDFADNYFITESVHNLVHRLVLNREGVTFRGRRAPGEERSEFLSSRDSWFRPVQTRTGPDGGLWIVDMHRAVIEHPRWIPEETLARINVRAGSGVGRIYRIRPRDTELRPVPNLLEMSVAELVDAFATPNGTVRDLIQRQLVERGAVDSAPVLARLARESSVPAVRAQALATLDGLGALKPEVLISAVADEHPEVRRVAVRLSEPFLNAAPALAKAVAAMVADPEMAVRYQVALTLGEWNDPRAGDALAEIVAADLEDAWMRAAVLTSAVRHAAPILGAVVAAPDSAGRREMIGGLVATAAGAGDPDALAQSVEAIVAGIGEAGDAKDWPIAELAELAEAAARNRGGVEAVRATLEASGAWRPLVAVARKDAFESGAESATRAAAIRFLSAMREVGSDDLRRVASWLSDETVDAELFDLAIDVLGREQSAEVAELVLVDWNRRTPGIRERLVRLLLSRDAWTLALLAAVEAGSVPGTDLPLSTHEELAGSGNAKVRDRAEAVLAEFRPRRREDVLAAYANVGQLIGRRPAGARIFEANCAACHSFRGKGQAFGPDIATFRTKTVREFVEAILDPNAVIEPRFRHYLIETRDGRRLAGILGEESANGITVVQMGGLTESLLRGEIAGMHPLNRSMMPEGFEARIDPQGMADLIAYLRSDAPAAFGSASGAAALAARKELRGIGINGLTRVIEAAERIDYPSWLGTLPMPHCRQTNGNSRVVWETQPVADSLDPDGWSIFRLPIGMGNAARHKAGGFALKLNGEHALDFEVSLDDAMWESADGTVRMLYEVRERNRADTNGLLTIEVANARLRAGTPVKFEVLGAAAGSGRWFGVYLVSETEEPAPADVRPLGEQILDDRKPAAARTALIARNPARSAEILRDMIAGQETWSEDEEYRRIPWIWRVTIAAGKRNDLTEMRELLDLSLPASGAPLADWQAVVIGGGLINGITLAGGWPDERIEQMLGNDAGLRRRWEQALNQAMAMADNEETRSGTRYDALRMIALLPWAESGEQLQSYLAPGTKADLQQGAVSGLGDMRVPEAAAALVASFAGLEERNRDFAIEALTRTNDRATALLDALESGSIDPALLTEAQSKRLRTQENPALRAQAERLLSQK